MLRGRHEKRIMFINITVSALRMELAATAERTEQLQVWVEGSL